MQIKMPTIYVEQLEDNACDVMDTALIAYLKSQEIHIAEGETHNGEQVFVDKINGYKVTIPDITLKIQFVGYVDKTQELWYN